MCVCRGIHQKEERVLNHKQPVWFCLFVYPLSGRLEKPLCGGLGDKASKVYIWILLWCCVVGFDCWSFDVFVYGK